MSRASLVTAAVALVGALLAWRFLPARAAEAQAPAAHEPVERLEPAEPDPELARAS